MLLNLEIWVVLENPKLKFVSPFPGPLVVVDWEICPGKGPVDREEKSNEGLAAYLTGTLVA